MNIPETTQLLVAIARFDNRDYDQATINAWHMMLEDVSYADAEAAVKNHFRNSHDYFTVTHIHDYVKAKAVEDEKFMADAVKTARGLGLVEGWPTRLTDEEMHAVLDWRERNNAKYQNTRAINDGTPNTPINVGTIGRAIPGGDRRDDDAR
jgi:hypothetical protein